MSARRVLIMGAAGRDFHNFNVVYRQDPTHEVVAFTAAQIPGIQGRGYPPDLAGPNYPAGIPILPESDLVTLIREKQIDQVDLAYSDLPHLEVMHRASMVLAAGADFCLLGPKRTQLRSACPVVSIGAVRTGAGKSPTTRRVCRILRTLGRSVVAVRHPMPYGQLARQAVQRFADPADLDRHECTIEEREEYEPLIDDQVVVFAGVDYERILRKAEQEADVIVWDGGNNDLPFFASDLHIVVADPHRAGHEKTYHPGEANARAADVFVLNKVDTAPLENVLQVHRNLQELNPQAVVIEAASPIRLNDPAAVRDRRVLVVEDGPTVTHGGMPYGAGWLAARRAGAVIVDPRPWAVGSLQATYREHPHLGPILPAMGYGEAMIHELEQTINAAEVDAVVVGTPIDLGRFLRIGKPLQRARYELQEIGLPTLVDVLQDRFAASRRSPSAG